MIRFLLFGLLVFATPQVVAMLVLRRRLRRWPLSQKALLLWFVLINLPWLFAISVLSEAQLPTPWQTAWLVRPFLTWQFGVFFWAVLSLLGFVLVTLPYRRWRRGRPQPAPVDLDRRRFLAGSARAAVWTGVGTATTWGLVHAGRPPRLVQYDLDWPQLPPELVGLRIAHLSDLHVGIWTTAAQIEQALEQAAAQAPDLVVLTGDLVDHNPKYGELLVQRLPLLGQPPLGVFGVLGNHDVYTGADGVTAVLEAGGLRMLRNHNTTFGSRGMPLTLLGIDDPGRRVFGRGPEPSLAQALRGAPEEHFQILLVHRPSGFAAAQQAGVPLTLCGHTHGGQLGIPGGPSLATLAFEFSHGVYRRGASRLHVSAGIGAVGVPFRLGVDPEVTVLRLVRSDPIANKMETRRSL